MQHDTITFQIATHYLPKIALRLECLYQTIKKACEESNHVIHHYALKNIIEILHIIDKPELKSRFLKELMRIEHNSIKSDHLMPSDLSNKLQAQIQMLGYIVGLFGEGIHHDPFLQIFRQALPTHNQDCEIYPPQLSFWLESEASLRQSNLSSWLASLNPLYVTVTLYLKLLRNTAQFDNIALMNGFYQRSLPPKTQCHLILLRINKSFKVVPRVQLGHHGLSLRLCEANTMREVKETKAKCDLAICQI